MKLVFFLLFALTCDFLARILPHKTAETPSRDDLKLYGRNLYNSYRARLYGDYIGTTYVEVHTNS